MESTHNYDLVLHLFSIICNTSHIIVFCVCVCVCGGEIPFGWFSCGPRMGVDSKTGIIIFALEVKLKNYYSMSFYFGLFLTIPSPSSSFHPPPSQWSMVWMTRVVPCWRMTTSSFYWTEVPPCGMRPQEWFPPW